MLGVDIFIFTAHYLHKTGVMFTQYDPRKKPTIFHKCRGNILDEVSFIIISGIDGLLVYFHRVRIKTNFYQSWDSNENKEQPVFAILSQGLYQMKCWQYFSLIRNCNSCYLYRSTRREQLQVPTWIKVKHYCEKRPYLIIDI